MERNPIFHQTRFRLAVWYSLVMGGILGLSGFGVYSVVAHAYHETINQGLQSVANALHKGIESAWQPPGQLQSLAKEFSLELCVDQKSVCLKQQSLNNQSKRRSNPVNYYIQLIGLLRKNFCQWRHGI